MENEYRNAVGKSMGEVIRDTEEFLSTPFVINKEKQIDLLTLVPDLNMRGQFCYALCAEALEQGWDLPQAEQFLRRACADAAGEETVNATLGAFADRRSAEFAALTAKYGNRFALMDQSFWSTALALAIDAGQVPELMTYFRLFTVTLTEFAFMGDRNPKTTYTWVYHDSFSKVLDDLTSPPEEKPLPPKIRALGGTSGKREDGAYFLSLGLDIENPNEKRMLRGIVLDVTLKDASGAVITVIRDKLGCIDPHSVFHYGITKKIRGEATANISASVKFTDTLRLETPIMNHLRLTSPRIRKDGSAQFLSGKLESDYPTPLRAMTLHYQFLDATNHILGGGNEWFLGDDVIREHEKIDLGLAVPFRTAAKIVCSADFDPIELLDDEK